jgi:hypothetical protein
MSRRIQMSPRAYRFDGQSRQPFSAICPISVINFSPENLPASHIVCRRRTKKRAKARFSKSAGQL